MTAEVKPGDVVQAGIVVSNSETGMGSLRIEPLVFRLVCRNGAIINDARFRKYHVGRGHDGGEEGVSEFFADETRKADDRALWLKVRDVVRATLDQVRFGEIIKRFQKSIQARIEGNPVKVVELTTKKFGLSEVEGGSVLKHLISGGELSAFGLMNAITRTAQDSESYDRATELERIGPSVIELPRSEWTVLSTAN